MVISSCTAVSFIFPLGSTFGERNTEVLLFLLSEPLFQRYSNVFGHRPHAYSNASWEKLKSLGHYITHTDGKKVTPCVYCSINSVRSKSGRKTYTRCKCSLCDVPLCTKNRDCFNLFHRSVLENS